MDTICDDHGRARDLTLAGESHLFAQRTWPLIFAGGVIALLLLFRAHFGLVIAKGESMHPGLSSGDLLLVDKLAYKAASPERGDIVLARDGDYVIIKRVVGLPGEEVELRRGELHVNRRALAEDYAVEPGSLSLRKGTLFDNKYALLGDNRSVSSSVFVHAVVSKDQVLGKVIHSVRLWPAWWGRGSIEPQEMAEPTPVAYLAIGKEP